MKRRLWLVGAIAIGVVVLITFLAAPASNKLNSGSTYGRGPEGYGAWYAYMEQRGTPVTRWRKPLEDLAKEKNAKPPITFLRVTSQLVWNSLDSQEYKWVEKGNTLVIVGVLQPATEASFSTRHQIEAGRVKIDTTRRNKDAKEQLLGDRFGAIVWQESIGKGRVIYATTPHLAANAYQDFRGNYEFLAQLVTQSGVRNQDLEASKTQNFVFVDEYSHGYRDTEVIKREQRQGAFSYLAKTPVFPVLVQGFILLVVAIWAGNRRFGKPLTLSTPTVNNSEAYIQALAGVLQKANSSEFVVDVVAKEEQLQLQKALFLGQEPLNEQALLDAWVRQTGRPSAELEQVLQMRSQKRRMSETELLNWLGKWQEIHRQVLNASLSR